MSYGWDRRSSGPGIGGPVPRQGGSPGKRTLTEALPFGPPAGTARDGAVGFDSAPVFAMSFPGRGGAARHPAYGDVET